MKALWTGLLIGFVAGVAFSESVRADIYCADYGYTVQCSGMSTQAWGYRTPYGKSFTIRQMPNFMDDPAYQVPYMQRNYMDGTNSSWGTWITNRGFVK